MQTKYCPDCGGENVITAKFCMTCRLEFPQIAIATTQKPATTSRPVARQTPKPIPKVVRLEYDITDNEDEIFDDIEAEGRERLSEDDAALANSFIEVLEATGKLQPKAGPVKLGDVLGTNKKGGKGQKRSPDSKIPKNGLDILKSTSNSNKRSED